MDKKQNIHVPHKKRKQSKKAEGKKGKEGAKTSQCKVILTSHTLQ
jgi:hypothetical protein